MQDRTRQDIQDYGLLATTDQLWSRARNPVYPVACDPAYPVPLLSYPRCRYLEPKSSSSGSGLHKMEIRLTISLFIGALAQLVERNNGIVEVNGSTPLRSMY